MKRIVLFIAIVFIFITKITLCQVSVDWQYSTETSTFQDAEDICATSDGGIIICSSIYSGDQEVFVTYGNLDILVTKFDIDGNVQWQKNYGGFYNDIVVSILQTIDGGYVIAANSFSDGDDISGNHGSCDMTVIKISSIGEVEWQKCIGGSNDDICSSMILDDDNGIVLVGETESTDGDIESNQGLSDGFIVKLTEEGEIEWIHCYGGSESDSFTDVVETVVGTYIVTGTTFSNDGDFIGNHGESDVLFLKLNSSGEFIVSKCFGSSGFDSGGAVIASLDGSYVLCAKAGTADGDISESDGSDVWVVKSNYNGLIQWEKTFGGNYEDVGVSIIQNDDGTFVIAADKGDYPYDIQTYDILVFKITNSGNLLWDEVYGGEGFEHSHKIIRHEDGIYSLIANYGIGYNGVGIIGSSSVSVMRLIEPNISGFMFNDQNGDGYFDTDENGINGHIIKLEPGPHYAITNNEGYYYFDAGPGTYQISYVLQNYWINTTPNLSNANVLYSGYIGPSYDFGVQALSNIIDESVIITGSPTRTNSMAYYWLTYGNLGTQDDSGIISFEYDPILEYMNSSQTPISQDANVISWLTEVVGATNQVSIRCDLAVPGVEYLGTNLECSAYIQPDVEDIDPINNYDTIHQVITASYDPNVKLVEPMGLGSEGYLQHGERLTYTIHFQNTGNDTAFLVVLQDTIDANLDIETFDVLAYSHEMDWVLRENSNLSFVFPEINLPDSTTDESNSHGFVKYSISPKEGLLDFTEVRNTAHIYFDSNYPIVTETVLTTFVSDAILTHTQNELNNSSQLELFPNPAFGSTTLNTGSNSEKEVSIFNLNGELIYRYNSDSQYNLIDLTNYNQGIYLVIVKMQDEVSFVKLVKY
jgi:uncharacterized repeat protein (TIGR01451 family)